jgi:hypothetical protein
MKSFIHGTLALIGLCALHTAHAGAKFEPPAGEVLVFVGQDNASVGGNGKYQDGYVDNIGVPAGITHYIYLTDGWKNKFGYTLDKDRASGLNSETTWGAGPMSMKAYADSPELKDCLIHLSISMEGNSEDKVADGTLDHQIEEVVQFLKTYHDRAFFVRIGYEFDGSWNGYDPENFKKAFKRIVDKMREAKLTNFATVMASSGNCPIKKWKSYYPGDEYVDWLGYSYFNHNAGKNALTFAREVNKPVFVAEATPKGTFLDREEGEKAWNKWYRPFFKSIEKNKDVIHAISYINADWDAQPMWDNWGNTRLEANDFVKEKWLQEMKKPMYINAEDKPMDKMK